jgi:chromosomal replication initiation ATPase DnaA
MMDKKTGLSERELRFLEKLTEVSHESTGSIPLNENGEAIFTEKERRRLWREAFDRAGIPAPYHFKNMDEHWNLKQYPSEEDMHPKEQKKKHAVQQFTKTYIKAIPGLCADEPIVFKVKVARKPPKVVTHVAYCGGQDSGKTFIASAIAQEVLRRGLRVHFFTWADLVEMLSDFSSRVERDELKHMFMKLDLVIIDSICMYDRKSPLFPVELDRIIQARIHSGKPLVMTILEDDSDTKSPTEIVGAHCWNKFVETCFKVHLPSQRGSK